MTDPLLHSSTNISISLVDGDPVVRRARQIMLRSEGYDVRSYASCAALLADPHSRQCACLIVDVHMHELDGFALLGLMRASGWCGKGILLDAVAAGGGLAGERSAAPSGDTVLAAAIGDGSLIAAVRACLHDRSRSVGFDR